MCLRRERLRRGRRSPQLGDMPGTPNPKGLGFRFFGFRVYPKPYPCILSTKKYTEVVGRLAADRRLWWLRRAAPTEGCWGLGLGSGFIVRKPYSLCTLYNHISIV